MSSIVYVSGMEFFEEVYVYIFVCVYYVGYNDVLTFSLHVLFPDGVDILPLCTLATVVFVT